MKNPDSTTVQLPVVAVNVSENSKTGLCSATYVSGKTCPESCPFRGGPIDPRHLTGEK